MNNLLEFLKDSKTNLKLEINKEDLLQFSKDLINRTLYEFKINKPPTKDDFLLTKEEVKKLCGVCDATLWHWAKKKYLVPIKIGSKVKYRASDVNKIMGIKNEEGANENGK